MLNFFVDVPTDSYYYDAVLWAAANGITTGTDETHFSPEIGCTRAQVVTFLWRAVGSPLLLNMTAEGPAMENPFTDVPTEDYFYNAVLWAVKESITNGVSDTAFAPAVDCTRAQIVTFLYRYMGK